MYMRNEIVRRGSLLDTKTPRPKAWLKTQCLQWLKEHPSKEPDILFAQTNIYDYIHQYKDDIKRLCNSLTPKEIQLFRLYESCLCDELR